MSDEGPDLMAVSIDYGDGSPPEELIVTDGFTSFHPYSDEEKHTVAVEEIVLVLEITSIEPTSAVVGGADVTLTVTGTGFSPTSVILFNGGEEATERVSSTELTTLVKPSTAGTPGAYPVAVYRPEDDATSDEVDFTFTEEGGEPEALQQSDEYDPNAPDEDYEVEAGYDPAAHTVTEVIGYVEDNPDQLEGIYAAEEAGKARSTLLAHLDGMRT